MAEKYTVSGQTRRNVNLNGYAMPTIDLVSPGTIMLIIGGLLGVCVVATMDEDDLA